MNKFIYILFLSVFFLDYLSNKLHLVNRYLSFLPELLSIAALLIIPARFMIIGGKNFPPKCVFLLIFLFLNILIGAIINLEPAAPLIAGLRVYLKPIPFFILPFVYPFSKDQISRQLKFILYLFLIQTPISLYQRFIQSRGLLTGDLVTGTLTTSGHLTIVLCCAIAITMCFYLEKTISLKKFITLFLFLFIPMTINETKVTLILLPIALIMPIMSFSGKISIKQYIPMFITGIFSAVAFFAIYDYFISARWGYGLLDFLTMEGRTEDYLYKGASTKGDAGKVGRVDTYVLAFKSLYDNILSLFFGLGIGNVSESSISGLSGEYSEKYREFNVNGTSLAVVLWEMGIFGVILYYTLYFMAYKDGKQLGHCGGTIGTFASGWSVVAIIMMISATYNNVIQENATGYLFWYFSGYIISECYRYRKIHMKA